MLSYLEKFKQLPEEVRQKMADPETMSLIKRIEAEYAVSLATAIMRVLIKEISILDLPKFFVFEYNMDARAAERMVYMLKDLVFSRVADHLGLALERPVPAPALASEDKKDASLADWIESRKKEAEVRGSSFFFSAEDEEEVRGLAKKVADFNIPKSVPAEKVLDYDSIISKVAKSLNLSFSSDDLRNRFRNTMTTYLRGIRNKIDTKQALQRDISSGGLGLNEIYADNILALTESAKAEALSAPAVPAPSSAAVNPAIPLVKARTLDIAAGAARDVDYDFKNMPSANREAVHPAGASAPIKQAPAAPSLSSAPLPLSPLSVPSAPSEVPDLKKNFPAPPAPSAPSESPSPRPLPPIEVMQTAPSANAGARADRLPPVQPDRKLKAEGGKVRIEDVKHVPKLTGPIDELQEMDLSAFRRISLDPGERVRKIKDKICFLEEDSYGQRLSAIKAWRHSPVNTLYLDIGRESISAHTPINAIINARRDKGGEYLTEEEFSAIMSLNKYLRY